MNMVALLMRPWIMNMKENEIEPRTLADDLFFYTIGKQDDEEAIEGMEISLQYFQDIGAQVAKHKCFRTSTDEGTRNSLRNRFLGIEGIQMQMLNQFRDLRGHVCMDMTKSAVTLNQRIQRAIEQIGRLTWMKITKTTFHYQNRYLSSCALWL